MYSQIGNYFVKEDDERPMFVTMVVTMMCHNGFNITRAEIQLDL